jgi:hypothetical protein
MKIDFVLPWVDSNDKRWQNEKAKKVELEEGIQKVYEWYMSRRI